MNETLLWALKLVLGALLVTPFVWVTGCDWIDHWYKMKAKFVAYQMKAQAQALSSMAEQIKNDSAKN